jgi:predicted nucleotidyltransferase component of viral defense system
MLCPSLNNFILVGGTALALQFGHRISIDLDLIGNVDDLNYDLIHEELREIAVPELTSKSSVMVGYVINNVKVDIVKYKYSLIKPVIVVDGLRLAQPEDIAAMKLASITGRGMKKDFYDLFFLLKKFSFEQMFNFYDKKYPDGNRFLVMRSLIYFVDAEEDDDPILFDPLKWTEVKAEILDQYKSYLSAS